MENKRDLESVPEEIAIYIAPIFDRIYGLFASIGETYDLNTCDAIVKKLGEEYVGLHGNISGDQKKSNRFSKLVSFGSELGRIYSKITFLWERIDVVTEYLNSNVANPQSPAYDLGEIINLNGVWASAKAPVTQRLERMISGATGILTSTTHSPRDL